MKISKKTKIKLIALLTAVNLILRYPVTPHEIGWDSYVIHISANSISSYGFIKWWLNPSCIFGFHPYSYASSVPLELSGISQTTAINMEWTIWLFSLLIGLFSALTAYIMAGAIKNEDLFKILVSFIYSTSAGILYFTTWTVSTRGLFIVLLPLFIYVILKSSNCMKYPILIPILFIFLATTHHLFYYLAIPVIAYLVVEIYSKFSSLETHLDSTKKISKVAESLIIPLCFMIMLIIPFLTRSLMPSGSRYSFMISQLIEYSRNIGVLVIFIFGALIYLLAKKNKNYQEMFLLVTFIGVTPFFYLEKYTKWFFLPIAALLVGVGLENTIKTICDKKKEYVPLTIILLLIFSVIFVGYLQFLNDLNDSDVNTRYMTEETHKTALWIKNTINKPVFGNDIPTTQRILSVTEIPTLTGSSFDDLAYGFVTQADINVTQNRSYLSPEYYIYDPYIDNNPSTSWYLSAILDTSFNSGGSYAQRWIKKFNLEYFVEHEYFQRKFVTSIQDTGHEIYDSGILKVWKLK